MNNKRIVMCTSSGCLDYAPEKYKKYNIVTLSLNINFQGKDYVEGVDLDPVWFYKELETLKNPKENLPRSAMVTKKAVYEAFDKAIEEGYEEIIVVALSSYLSGSYSVICTAAEEYKDKIKITVVDSKICSFNEGYLAYKAAELIEKGVSTEEIVKELKWIIDRQEFVGVDAKLDYLIYNGRLKGGKALIGKMMQICPVVGFDRNGVLDSICSVRTPKKALNKMCEIIKERIGDRKPEDYILFHVYTGESLLEDLKAIEEEHGIKCNHEDVIMAPATGASNGPWLAGYGYVCIRREDELLD